MAQPCKATRYLPVISPFRGQHFHATSPQIQIETQLFISIVIVAELSERTTRHAGGSLSTLHITRRLEINTPPFNPLPLKNKKEKKMEKTRKKKKKGHPAHSITFPFLFSLTCHSVVLNLGSLGGLLLPPSSPEGDLPIEPPLTRGSQRWLHRRPLVSSPLGAKPIVRDGKPSIFGNRSGSSSIGSPSSPPPQTRSIMPLASQSWMDGPRKLIRR